MFRCYKCDALNELSGFNDGLWCAQCGRFNGDNIKQHLSVHGDEFDKIGFT